MTVLSRFTLSAISDQHSKTDDQRSRSQCQHHCLLCMYDLQIEIEIAEEVQICYMVQAVAQSNYYFKIKRSKIKVSLIKPQARTAS